MKHARSVIISKEAKNGIQIHWSLQNFDEDDWWGKRVDKEYIKEKKEGEKVYRLIQSSRYWEDEYKKLFCKCGYEGKPIQLASQLENIDWIKHQPNDVNYRFFYLPIFGCPICYEKATHVVDRYDYTARGVLEFVALFDNREDEKYKRNTVTICWGNTYYYYNSDVEKLAVTKTTRVRLTHNLDTGMTYIMNTKKKKSLRNITYGLQNTPYHSWIHKEINSLSHANPEQIQTIIHFFQLCLEARGVKYKTLEDICFTEKKTFKSWMNGNKNENFQTPSFGLGKLENAFVYMRFPHLQHLPTYYWGDIPKEVRKRLHHTEPTAKDLYRNLIGHSSKRIRKLTNNPTLMSYFAFIGPLIDEPDNLYKLLEETIKENEHCEKEEPHRFNPKKEIYPKDEYVSQKIKAFQFIRKQFKNETVFVNMLLKIKRKKYIHQDFDELFDFDDFDPFETNTPKVEEKYIEVFDYYQAMELIVDSYQMYKEIKQALPRYKLKKIKSLEEFHDELGRDYNRIEQEEIEIPYKEKEFDRYEKEINGYQFTLAKSNHELIHVGNEMSICVGSYSKSAIRRETTIVLVKNQEKKLYMCIEIKPNGNKVSIIQAKLHRNKKPEKEVAKMVKKWCRQSQIVVDHCRDLQVNS